MHLSEQVTIDRGAIEAPDIGDYAPRVSIYAPGDNSDAILQEFGTYSFSVDAGKMLLRSGRWRLEGKTFEVGIDGTVGCADCVVSGTADVCYRKYYKDDGDDDVDAIRLSSGTVDMLRFAVCEVTLPNGTVIEKSSKNANTGFSVSAGGIIYNFQSAAAFKVKDAHGKTYDFAMSADGSALTCTDSEGTTSSYAMDAESPKAILLSEEGVGLAVIAATKEGDKLSLTLPALSADEEAVLTDADGMVYGILAYQGQSDESVGGTYTLTAESNAIREINLSNLGTATLTVKGAKLGSSTKYTAKGGSFTTGDKDFTVTQNGAQITLSDAESVTLLQAGDYKFTTATKATASAQGTYIINGNSYALSQNAEISVNGTATELTAGSVTLAKGNTVTVGTTAYTAAANNTSLANSGGKAKLTAGTVTLAKGKTLTVGKTTYTAAANNTTLDYNGGKAKLTVGTVTLDKGESVVVASLGTVTAKTGSLDVTSTGVLTGTSVDATAIKNTGTLGRFQGNLRCWEIRVYNQNRGRGDQQEQERPDHQGQQKRQPPQGGKRQEQALWLRRQGHPPWRRGKRHAGRRSRE